MSKPRSRSVAKASVAASTPEAGVGIDDLAALGEAAAILSRIQHDGATSVQAGEAASLGGAAIRALLDNILDETDR